MWRAVIKKSKTSRCLLVFKNHYVRLGGKIVLRVWCSKNWLRILPLVFGSLISTGA